MEEEEGFLQWGQAPTRGMEISRLQEGKALVSPGAHLGSDPTMLSMQRLCVPRTSHHYLSQQLLADVCTTQAAQLCLWGRPGLPAPASEQCISGSLLWLCRTQQQRAVLEPWVPGQGRGENGLLWGVSASSARRGLGLLAILGGILGAPRDSINTCRSSW